LKPRALANESSDRPSGEAITALHRDAHLKRETRLIALRIQRVKLRQAKVELGQAEVELKSKLVEYRIKRMAFYLAAVGLPAAIGGLEWGWLRALARWISGLTG
jgi:hypothetical protein